MHKRKNTIWNVSIFGDYDWPLSASRGFVSISWAFCDIYPRAKAYVHEIKILVQKHLEYADKPQSENQGAVIEVREFNLCISFQKAFDSAPWRLQRAWTHAQESDATLCSFRNLCSSDQVQHQTRNMYWRRASIQEGQAFTSAWWHHCSETVFFHDNFVIFRHRSKRIAFLESVNFSTCVYKQVFNFRNGDVTTFRHHLGANIFQMPGHRLFILLKRHTFRASAFHQCYWFGVKLFPVGCVQDSRRAP